MEAGQKKKLGWVWELLHLSLLLGVGLGVVWGAIDWLSRMDLNLRSRLCDGGLLRRRGAGAARNYSAK